MLKIRIVRKDMLKILTFFVMMMSKIIKCNLCVV